MPGDSYYYAYIIINLLTVPSIFDITIGFREDGAEPTLKSVLNGEPCHAEMFVR